MISIDQRVEEAVAKLGDSPESLAAGTGGLLEALRHVEAGTALSKSADAMLGTAFEEVVRHVLDWVAQGKREELGRLLVALQDAVAQHSADPGFMRHLSPSKLVTARANVLCRMIRTALSSDNVAMATGMVLATNRQQWRRALGWFTGLDGPVPLSYVLHAGDQACGRKRSTAQHTLKRMVAAGLLDKVASDGHSFVYSISRLGRDVVCAAGEAIPDRRERKRWDQLDSAPVVPLRPMVAGSRPAASPSRADQLARILCEKAESASHFMLEGPLAKAILKQDRLPRGWSVALVPTGAKGGPTKALVNVMAPFKADSQALGQIAAAIGELV